MIRFGPGGLGGVKEAVSNLENYKKLGLKACEIEFTYGIYINEKEAEEIKKAAEKNGIKLSIHAPYWINLNSKEKSKVEGSKRRILECCKIGNKLNAYCVVFHPGYYLKDKEEDFNKIAGEIKDMQEEIKKNKWEILLAPETSGKINVFGSPEEILRLVEKTGCFFTIDFAHLKARTKGKMSYNEMADYFKNFRQVHAHFSGIEWSDKGERKHVITPESELRKLLNALPKNKEFVIINESPDPVGDSVKGLKIYEKL